MKQTMQYYASRGIATLLLIMVAALMPQPASADGTRQPSGDGTSASPYLIGDADELYWFAEQVNGGETNIHAVLTADITLTGNTNGYVIGTYEHAFAGVFDGDGHTVSGVNVTTTKKGNKGYLYAGGLFGIINAPTDTTAEVKNLTIEGSVDITPGQQVYYIGGVIGIAYGTVKMSHITSHVNLTIRDCVVDAHCGGIVASGEWFGSQDAYHQSTLYLSHCANYGTLNVSCKETCGGIIGFINNGAITDCLNAGAITNCLSADNTTTAGILGYVNSTTCKMSRCLNVGAVKNTQPGGKTYPVYYADNGVIGTVSELYYKTGTATSTSASTTAVTEEQLKSGEVCWLLNGGTAEGDIAWRQTLGSDAHPVLDTEHKRVYYGYKDCQHKTYGNDKDAISDTPQEHAYVNGFCTVCGDYQQATKKADDVYEIANAGQLYWFAQKVNGGETGINGMLVNNIVVNDSVLKADGSLSDNYSTFRVWTRIGYGYWYKGTFDGQGHTISGLYVNNTDMASVGLFGETDDTAKIKNVGVVDSYFHGDGRVGGICGANCGSLTNCYNTGTVSGNGQMVGGVCGYSNGSLTNCYNTGTVSGSNTLIGGVCGNGVSVNISNCYNTGTVSGSSNSVGGVCGGGTFANISNCYNTGKVTGKGSVGGVCGDGQEATITNCYYLKDSCPQGIGDGSGEATEKTEDQFKSGEVTWLLNKGTAEGDVAWRQNLGSDAFPVLDSGHGKVHFGYKCLQATYSNDPLPTTPKEHAYDNGFCLACGVYQPATKNADDVYEIANAGQLYWFAEQVNDVDNPMFDENAILTDNIVVNTGVLKADGSLNDDVSTFRVWTPIGKGGSPYAGTFDGQGYTISGLYLNDGGRINVGLFGSAYNANIENVGVIDSYFCGNAVVGGVCGFGDGCSITNCYNMGMVNGSQIVGGVCGYNGNCTNCYNTGKVSGTIDFGGLLGYNGNCTNCYYLKDSCPQGIGDGSGEATEKTENQFKSGEVAWLLNGTVAGESPAWRQTLDEDAFPVLDEAKGIVMKASTESLNSVIRPTAGTIEGATAVYNFAGIRGKDVYGYEYTEPLLAASHPYIFTADKAYVNFFPSAEEVTDDTDTHGLLGVLDTDGKKVYGKDNTESEPVSIVFTTTALKYANPKGNLVKYGKCYIDASQGFLDSEPVSEARGIAIFGEGTTSIDEIDATTGDSEGKAYNLQGVEVAKTYKGVVIANGRKMVRR